MSQGRMVGIVTSYGLNISAFEPRFLQYIFFIRVNFAPSAYPFPCSVGAGSLCGVKQPAYGVDHPPHLAPWLKMSTAVPAHSNCASTVIFRNDLYG